MLRPTDFAKLTAELKCKQALAAGLDEGAERAELEKRALTGDADAALTLGLMLRYGEGAGDRVHGEKLITAAAEAGNARAMAELGRILLADETRAGGPEAAERWLRQAWAAGESEGAFLLAGAQRLGLLEPMSNEDPAEILLAAAELGNDSARRLLIAPNEGDPRGGVTAEQVLRWTEELANGGDTDAMYTLGDRYRKLGNHAAAVAWFQRAAANGYAMATLALSNYGIGDQEVQQSVINHLRVQLSSPATADSSGRYTLAFLLSYQSDTEANRAEILGLLREAAGQHDYKAANALRLIMGGSAPRVAMGAMIGVDRDTAYAREVQTKSDALDQKHPETGELLNAVPKPLQTPKPQYPVELLAAKTAGNVTVQFVIDETGAVRDPQVIASDHPAFSAAVIEAIGRWRFTPGVMDGKTVATRTQIDFPFQGR